MLSDIPFVARRLLACLSSNTESWAGQFWFKQQPREPWLAYPVVCVKRCWTLTCVGCYLTGHRQAHWPWARLLSGDLRPPAGKTSCSKSIKLSHPHSHPLPPHSPFQPTGSSMGQKKKPASRNAWRLSRWLRWWSGPKTHRMGWDIHWQARSEDEQNENRKKHKLDSTSSPRKTKKIRK